MWVPAENSVENLFQASLLAPGGLLATGGFPWLLLHHPGLCLHRHMASSLCVFTLSSPCVCLPQGPNFPFL